MTTICQVGSPALTWAGLNQSEPAPAERPERSVLLLSLGVSCCRGPGGPQRLPDTVTPSAEAVGPTGLEHQGPIHPAVPRPHSWLHSAVSPKGSGICQEVTFLELLEEKEQ